MSGPPVELDENDRVTTDGEVAASLRGVRLVRGSLRSAVVRLRLAVVFFGAFVFFAVARQNVFLTWTNARGILDDASVLSLLAVGVTVVLVIGEFDLSVGFV